MYVLGSLAGQTLYRSEKFQDQWDQTHTWTWLDPFFLFILGKGSGPQDYVLGPSDITDIEQSKQCYNMNTL